jgi:hypothetical protein
MKGWQKYVRFAQRARSAGERRALLKLARTWASLATQTEAYDTIVLNWSNFRLLTRSDLPTVAAGSENR